MFALLTLFFILTLNLPPNYAQRTTWYNIVSCGQLGLWGILIHTVQHTVNNLYTVICMFSVGAVN